MLIDLLPVWVLFFVFVAMVLGSVEIGFRIGRTVCAGPDHERESPASSISAVILSLQAFMLAFTFSIVSDRYDAKKALVREEASTMRVAFNRADFLREPDRGRSKALLSEYLDQRITLAQDRNPESIQKFLANALQTHQELWAMALANGKIDMDSDVGALYIESVNDITKLHATRVSVGLLLRIPTGIWIVLLSLLTLGMVALGYYTAIADSRRSRVTLILAVAFAMVIALIAALDHPGDDLIPVSQQPLIQLQSDINARSDNGTLDGP